MQNYIKLLIIGVVVITSLELFREILIIVGLDSSLKFLFAAVLLMLMEMLWYGVYDVLANLDTAGVVIVTVRVVKD